MVVDPLAAGDVASATAGEAVPFLRLLGPPEIRVAGQVHPLRSERSNLLLAYLGCAGTWVSREKLADLFWPDRSSTAARSNLRNVLFTARALPFSAGLQIDSQGVRWVVATDLQRLQRAVAERNWSAAVGLCRGPLLDGLDAPAGMQDWLEAERAQAMTLWREAVLGAAAEGTAGVVEAAGRLLATDPFDEAVVLALVHLLRELERPVEALRVGRTYAAKVRGELGVEPSAAVRTVLDEFQRERAIPVAARADVTRFFGRAQELGQLDELLVQFECRLLTITGSGGSGKTRLARRAAELARGPWHWVALESISRPDEVAGAIAQAVGAALRDAAGALSALAEVLRDGSRLLVLDNCEHVLDAMPLITDLLVRCPQLRVLATSRVRLGLDGEWLLPVAGFPYAKYPDEDGEAERFFAQSAQRTSPGFTLTPDNRASVHEIAAMLAGNPLALELAASWVRMLPLPEIAAEIRRDIGLLGAGASVSTERHRSLRASFEHSWRLLSERERDALARLAVFRGGFTREAALQVTAVPLPVLAALLDESLLRYDGRGRYDRHPLIYQFTQHKLAADPALADRMRGRHAQFFTRFLEDEAAQALPRRQRLQQLRADWENVMLATEWLAEHGDWDALARCSTAISRDPSAFGNLDVGAAWGGRMLGLIGRGTVAPPAALAARIQADRLWLQIFLELPDRALQLARDALRSAQVAGSVPAQVQVLRALGHLARKGARNLEAAEHFAHALALARDTGMVREEAMLLDALAMVENRTGRYDAAADHARAALALNERIGADEQRMYNYFNLGESRLLSRQPADALPWLTQCVALAREIDFEQFLTYAQVALAQCRLALGDRIDAEKLARQARSDAQRLDDQTAAGLARLVLARARLLDHDPQEARREVHAALETALQRDDGLVQVAAIPVAARICLDDRRDAALRWLHWIAARPDLSFDAANEARQLISEQASPDSAAHDDEPTIDLIVIARDIAVCVADDAERTDDQARSRGQHG